MFRKSWAAALLGIAAFVAAGVPGPAYADTAAIPVVMSGTGDLGTDTITHPLPASPSNGDLYASGSLSTTVNWTQNGVVSVDWDPNLVRQGRSLDPTVGWTPTAAGTLSATFSMSGEACVYVEGSCIGFSLGPVNFSTSGPCALNPGGASYGCHLESSEIELFEPCPDPFDTDETSSCPFSPRISAKLVSDVTVSPEKFATLRTATLAGDPVDTSDLLLEIDPITDELDIACSAGVGDDLGYHLGDLSSSPGLSINTSLVFTIAISEPIPAPFTFIYVDIASPSIGLGNDSGSAQLTGNGGDVAMGPVQANNVPPTLTVADSFSGEEGTPIQFAASATGPCAAGASYAWHFSDGTTAFGKNPQKEFSDSGPYSGSVTVTDTTGLTDTEDFDVQVDNLAPAVQVLPNDPTIAWGRDLTLEAQAVDPGAGDQGTLTYAWTFGDSTPEVIGGPVETHAWTTPGSYNASVEVCDDDGGCTTDGFVVDVRRRNTSVGYTGANVGIHSAMTNLAGSLVDEYGNPVNGATLSFDLAGAPAGTAQTNASGAASKAVTVGMVAGLYDVSSSFAGNPLYAPSGPATEAFEVSTMATTLVYTGTRSSKPNATIPLSAKLTDFLGRPHSGYQVTFRIGTQTVTATTDATGVAATSLKLSQKPGTYALEASWAGDPGKYEADNDTGFFKLNSK